VPELRHTSFVLHLEGLSGKLQDDLESILPYTYPAAEFAAVSYIRGSIDAPKHLDPKDILLLFPTITGGGLIQFDSEKWEREHPYHNGYHIPMPGYSDLLSNYAIDPTIPEAGTLFQTVPRTNKRRPGGGYVPDLTRWDDPTLAQALNLPQRSDQGDLTSAGKKKKISPTKPVLDVSKPQEEEAVASRPRSRIVTQNIPTAARKKDRAPKPTNFPPPRQNLNITVTSLHDQQIVPAQPYRGTSTEMTRVPSGVSVERQVTRSRSGVSDISDRMDRVEAANAATRAEMESSNAATRAEMQSNFQRLFAILGGLRPDAFVEPPGGGGSPPSSSS
jgi:hypothetical protein